MYQIAKIGKGLTSIKNSEKLDEIKLGDEVVWVNIITKKENDLVELKEFFGLHNLELEDCVDMRQRPKVEVYDNHTFIVMKDLYWQKNKTIVDQLALFIGKNFLLTVSNIELEEVVRVTERVKGEKNTKLLSPDFIAYNILDKIVDSYFPILDSIEDRIEVVENKVIKDPNEKGVTEEIFKVKRELLSLRKATWPSRDVFSSLSKEGLPFITAKNRVYYRDIYDHIIAVIDLIETYRELTSGVLDTYLSSISKSMNEVMKVLTVIATIFIPLTFITGLYGMNFQGGGLNMPELYWDYGYIFALALMLTVSLSMLWYFKKKKWV